MRKHNAQIICVHKKKKKKKLIDESESLLDMHFTKAYFNIRGNTTYFQSHIIVIG